MGHGVDREHRDFFSNTNLTNYRELYYVTQTTQIIKDLRTIVLDALIDLSPCERAPRWNVSQCICPFCKRPQILLIQLIVQAS